MGDHDYTATCLSSADHDVRDMYLHYFGCLKTTGRAEYLKSLPLHKQQRINAEAQRIRDLRALFESQDDTRALVQKLSNSLNHYFKRSTRRQISAPTPEKLTKDNAFGMNAYAIFFRDSVPYKDEHCSDQFPNQKILIKDLIYNRDEKTNPLLRKAAKKEIRYFHIPGNNMEWIEVKTTSHSEI